VNEYRIAFDFVETANQIDTVEELVGAFDALIKDFGFLAFVAANCLAPKLEIEPRILAATWPQGWTDLWLERNYVAVDPVVYQVLVQPTPIRWRDVRARASGVGAEVMDNARAFQFYDGICIPVRAGKRQIAGISMAGLECALNAHEELSLHLAAIYFHTRLNRLMRITGTTAPSLTPRECECLSWAAAGKTDWEISQILSIAEQTAKQHMKNAMHKLNALNRTQAVALAIHLDLIAL
jgi:LuxR family transcriptional regulator, quorum-sensing system regulator BjaR1